MKASRFSDAQKTFILKQGSDEMPAADIYATRLFRVTFLAPDIIAAIFDGRHPPELTVRKLLDDTWLPLDRSEQRAGLGFAPQLA